MSGCWKEMKSDTNGSFQRFSLSETVLPGDSEERLLKEGSLMLVGGS